MGEPCPLNEVLVRDVLGFTVSEKGGAIAYRTALWYPELVSHLFSVCTPYWAPSKTYTPLEPIVETRMPNWGYQLRLASGEVEHRIKSKDEIKQFLNAVYGGKAPGGESGFSHTKGPLYENLPKLNRTPLMGEDLLEFYGAEYERHGMRGTRKLFTHPRRAIQGR